MSLSPYTPRERREPDSETPEPQDVIRRLELVGEGGEEERRGRE